MYTDLAACQSPGHSRSSTGSSGRKRPRENIICWIISYAHDIVLIAETRDLRVLSCKL